MDLFLQPSHLGLESGDQVAEIFNVDAHADLLHAREDTDQGALDVVIELEEVARRHRLAEGRGEPRHGDGASPRVLSRLVGTAVEIQLPRRRCVGRAQLGAEVAHGQVIEQIVRIAGVDEIGADCGI